MCFKVSRLLKYISNWSYLAIQIDSLWIDGVFSPSTHCVCSVNNPSFRKRNKAKSADQVWVSLSWWCSAVLDNTIWLTTLVFSIIILNSKNYTVKLSSYEACQSQASLDCYFDSDTDDSSTSLNRNQTSVEQWTIRRSVPHLHFHNLRMRTEHLVMEKVSERRDQTLRNWCRLPHSLLLATPPPQRMVV